MIDPEIQEALTPVLDLLESLDIRYFIGGSLASSAFGVARSTLDVDMVADVKAGHVQEIVNQLEGGYYVDGNMIEEAIRNRSSFNLVHLPTGLKIDIFIPKARAFDQQSFGRIRSEPLFKDNDRPLHIASPEDIILNKLEWFRKGGETSDRQWGDILGVLQVQGTSLDFDYMKEWADELSLSDLLQKALDESNN